MEKFVSLLSRILKPRRPSELQPLYDAVVRRARDPGWYREGQVPDTLNGRFDMVAALLALVLLRLEREEDTAVRTAGVRLTEIFIDDMEGTIRQIGIGDLVVGKHVGRMIGALGGRLEAFRPGGDLGDAVVRNIFHESLPAGEAPAFVARRLERFRDELAGCDAAAVLAGALPTQ